MARPLRSNEQALHEQKKAKKKAIQAQRKAKNGQKPEGARSQVNGTRRQPRSRRSNDEYEVTPRHRQTTRSQTRPPMA